MKTPAPGGDLDVLVCVDYALKTFLSLSNAIYRNKSLVRSNGARVAEGGPDGQKWPRAAQGAADTHARGLIFKRRQHDHRGRVRRIPPGLCDSHLPIAATNPDTRDRITYVGHATVLLEVGGARILTDPMLRTRAGILRRHSGPVAAAHCTDIDLVLISHLHRDHLDLASLRALPRATPVIVPRGAAATTTGAGLGEVAEITVGETISACGVEVTSVPAVHDGRRDPWGARANPVGFVVSAGRRRIYFAGDTDLFEGMASIGALDLALLPVWGWGHRLGAGHLDPERAARALKMLRPRLAVPIHWGTYHPAGMRRTLGDRLTEPPLEFARLAARYAPGVRVEVLDPGAGLALGPEPSR